MRMMETMIYPSNPPIINPAMWFNQPIMNQLAISPPSFLSNVRIPHATAVAIMKVNSLLPAIGSILFITITPMIGENINTVAGITLAYSPLILPTIANARISPHEIRFINC